MSRSYVVVCDECGYEGRYASPALAAHHFPRHSCDKTRAEAARAERVAARLAHEGETRDCPHATGHRHGTRTAYILDRCRCRACTEANRVAARARIDRNTVAAWHPERSAFVSGDVVRAHLRALSRKGMGWKRVAAAAGVATSTVYPILYGKYPDDPTHPEHRPPRLKVRRDVAEKLLTVTFAAVDGTLVDAIGTHRRIRALVADGWSMSWQAKALGWTPTNYIGILSRAHVTQKTARDVAHLYDQVAHQHPANDASSTRARRHAARLGWPPAAAWDTDTIDDPKASPMPTDAAAIAARAKAVNWRSAS